MRSIGRTPAGIRPLPWASFHGRLLTPVSYPAGCQRHNASDLRRFELRVWTPWGECGRSTNNGGTNNGGTNNGGTNDDGRTAKTLY
jgi:hypothetical protein